MDITTLWGNYDKCSSETINECKMQDFQHRIAWCETTAYMSENLYFLTLSYELLTSSAALLASKLSPFEQAYIFGHPVSGVAVELDSF